MPFSNVSSVGKENTDTKPVCILLHRYTYLYITFLFMRLFIGIFTSPPLQDIIRGFIYIFCVILFVARARVRSYFSTILNRLIHFNSPLISFFGGVNKSQIIQLSNSDSRIELHVHLTHAFTHIYKTRAAPLELLVEPGAPR